MGDKQQCRTKLAIITNYKPDGGILQNKKHPRITKVSDRIVYI